MLRIVMHVAQSLFMVISAVCLLNACGGHPSNKEQCVRCHYGIERTTPSHHGCVSCHGGDPKATAKEAAHRGIYGFANRSYPGRWENGCGGCHRYQLARMQSSQMYTAAGMIAQIQATWEGETPTIRFGSHAAQLYDPAGRPFTLHGVEQLDNLSGELYRKFCVRCHLDRQQDPTNGSGNPAGCAACHFPYGQQALYRGGDPLLLGRAPHGDSHRMQSLPSLRACVQCHHRSGRTALSYQGLLDGNNSLVPTRDGQPGPVQGSDGRTYTHIAPDVHYLAGMDCIDCHTSREVMGEGYASASLHGQLEVTCESCHGSPTSPPRYRMIVRENEEPVRESRSYPTQIRPGMKMILTAKGRPFSNVFTVNGTVLVQLKHTGRLLRARVITGSPAHTVVGHGRLACAACHSRTVVQCYGCHTRYDRGGSQIDVIKGMETPGQFTETEDYRTLYPFPLALNREGRISPVTPGCQTFVTVLDAQGRIVQNEAIMRYKGKRQVRFAPFYGHNTGKRAVGCSECHANPAFLGFGQHVVAGRSITGTLICDLSDHKPLDGFLTMTNGAVRAYAAITRNHARPLNQREVQRTLAVNSCLVCHASAKDPIYRARIDYRALDDTIHRRLLAPRR